VCRAYYTNDFLARVAHEALELFAGGALEDAAYQRTGALFLHGQEEAGDVPPVVDRLASIGTPLELLDKSALESRFPGFVLDDIALGVWEDDGGRADPVGTTTGLYRKALDQGLTSRLRTTVTHIESSPEGVTVIAADGRPTTCERLLIAAGPWTAPLARQAGVDLPLTVERHWVVTCKWGSATPIPFVFADIPGGYYATPEGSNMFCLGPLSEEPNADPDHYDEGIHNDEVDRMLEPVARRVPALQGAEFVGGWASLYDVSPDWQPVIGEIAPPGSRAGAVPPRPLRGRPHRRRRFRRHAHPRLVGHHPSQGESSCSQGEKWQQLPLSGDLTEGVAGPGR
jgi:glycine/D-amino acid oxidase-like deaminating enzyme